MSQCEEDDQVVDWTLEPEEQMNEDPSSKGGAVGVDGNKYIISF
jgi:hypothetical protein